MSGVSEPEATPYFAGPALYDLMYAPIRADIPFYVGLATAARGPVLEVACGSGRVLVPCAEAGADMDGFDADPRMIEATRRRLEAQGLRAGLHVADMRRFALPRRYALITIPFSAFYHNTSRADQLATLARCREHLAPRGRLVLSVFSPDPRRLLEMDGEHPEVMEHDHPSGVGRVRVVDKARADAVEQYTQVERRVEISDAGGRILEAHDLDFDLRWIWPAEMRLLLMAAGFAGAEAEGRGGPQFAALPGVEPGGYQVWTAWKD
jgi:SAM-dependent methyltransferase